MTTEGQITLAILHDLALLCLALAHSTDEQLDPSEMKEIAAKLRRWNPDKDPALIDHVIREAILSYLNRSKTNRVDRAVDTIAANLSTDLRTEILRDLLDIASADGSIIPAEGGIIGQIARSWGVPLETSR